MMLGLWGEIMGSKSTDREGDIWRCHGNRGEMQVLLYMDVRKDAGSAKTTHTNTHVLKPCTQ